MLGNVWEWTSDNYDAESKVIRGGSWGSTPGIIRASLRDRRVPSDRANASGSGAWGNSVRTRYLPATQTIAFRTSLR